MIIGLTIGALVIFGEWALCKTHWFNNFIDKLPEYED